MSEILSNVTSKIKIAVDINFYLAKLKENGRTGTVQHLLLSYIPELAVLLTVFYRI
jgi:hypothetical protein